MILERENLNEMLTEENALEVAVKMVEKLVMSERNLIEINKVERQNVIDLQDRVKAEMEKADHARARTVDFYSKLEAEREKVAYLERRVENEVEICEILNRKIRVLDDTLDDYKAEVARLRDLK